MENELVLRTFIFSRTIYVLLTVVSVFSYEAAGARESYEAEYFTNASLPCNFTLHNLTYPGITIPFKKYWILPNTSVLADNFPGSERYHIEAPDPYIFNLRIDSIDDPDFGVYHCVLLWENIFYTTSVIRVALNEDGPLYKRQLETFQRNLLIGCISAGAAVIIVIIVCVACRCRKKKSKNEDTLSNLDYYTHNMKSRHAEHEYAISNRSVHHSEPRQPNAEEMYAKVNKTGSPTHGESVTISSAHL
ncbi:uncharacterized protein LOC132758010 [Ruditapes philippinarum]|uniref:uncharacterized protein LOC132758010 n=1 Tax=Ruditapes philippinarum TaxID=129788 RepID=UPI00295BD2E6|nr:uncharacterized protein LOC132758010 [Ruditapes philippinarum]